MFSVVFIFNWWKKIKKKSKKKRKVFSTRDSNVVTHHSTNLAHRCLTSEFRWDRVLSPGYDRRQMNTLVGSTSYGSKSRGQPHHKKKPKNKPKRNKHQNTKKLNDHFIIRPAHPRRVSREEMENTRNPRNKWKTRDHDRIMVRHGPPVSKSPH